MIESEFSWYLPTPPKPVLSITIPDEKSINLNGRLREIVPNRLKIGVNMDGTKLGLLEEQKGFHIPKNGMIKAQDVIHDITLRGISLPARYIVENIDDLWVATLVPTIPAPTTPKKTPNKPRLNGLKAMLPKNEMN